MTTQLLRVLAAALLILGCRETRTPASTRMMGMSMQTDSLMPMVRAHLDSAAQMASSMDPAMLANHDEIASRMLDAMGSDMRMMRMQADSAWSALADSVKRDLAELQSLSGTALETWMRAHVGRLRRLLDMHMTMMREPIRP